MELGLEGKVAWVLGGSSGLGKACARSLAAEGARVAISARHEQTLNEAAVEIGAAAAVPLDVSDTTAIEPAHQAVSGELGPIDILISNEGGPPPGQFDALGEDELHTAFDLTLASAWRLAKAVRPEMKGRGGCLVFITSSAVKEVIPHLLLSNMMRPGVVGLAKTLSKELASDGIRVLCIAPGRIHTPRIDQLNESMAGALGTTAEEVRKRGESEIPLGRYGRVEEFGDVVAFLASERASYLTGITIPVDGGLLSGLLS